MNFDSLIKPYRDEFLKHVRPEFQQRVLDKATIGLDEFKTLRMNSYEQKFIEPILSDEAFLYHLEKAINNTRGLGIYQLPAHYDEYVGTDGVVALLRRFKALQELERWIPVTESLPDNTDEVFIVHKNRHDPEDPDLVEDIGFYSDTQKLWFDRRYTHRIDNVVYWKKTNVPGRVVVPENEILDGRSLNWNGVDFTFEAKRTFMQRYVTQTSWVFENSEVNKSVHIATLNTVNGVVSDDYQVSEIDLTEHTQAPAVIVNVNDLLKMTRYERE